MMSSMLSHVQQFYEELRRAANNLAIVGLVTRFQHWISKYVAKMPVQPNPSRTERSSRLIKDLRILNDRLGEGPIRLKFFSDLEDVRDSVIHGDSRAEWKFPPNRVRHLADRYTNSWGDTEVSVEQLNEATANSIQQVKWFDEKLDEKKNLSGN